MIDVVLPIGVLLILLLALRALFQLVQNWILNRTIRLAIDKRPESLPMLLEKLEATGGEWRQDAVGWAVLAFGLAILAAAFIDASSDRLLIQFALMPLFVGAALLLHYRFARSRRA